MRDIFIPGIGQYDNIGDIVLRRQLLSWLLPLGRLHVFVGNAPEGYAESLGVSAPHVVYRNFGAWYVQGLKSAARGGASYVFKPGEIQITMAGLKEHVSMVPLQLLIKLRGGSVARVGAGARGFEKLPRAIMKPSLALTDLIVWRDARTASFLGAGEVMPDLAFGEGREQPRGEEPRDLLVVSMRSDRTLPRPEWLAAVRNVADRHDLKIVAVVQVERDSARSADLARLLEGDLDVWNGDDHDGHEQHLRGIYRRAALVVSDRLHVLLTATTEGASPLALLVDDSDKIERHFAAADLGHIAVYSKNMTTADMRAALEGALSSWEATAKSVGNARAKLTSVQRRLDELLTGRPDRTRTVWHVGRKGEVAGGMTQVVNSYLAWPFPQVRQKLLLSRTGSPGPREYAVFARAVARLPLLGARSRTVVVVHLSQNGSFIREGTLLRLARRLGYATVAHLHGSSFVDFVRNKPTRVRKTLSAADAIVTLSDETRDAVAELLPASRVEIVPNAVPAGTPMPKEKLVVFGGGVTRRKGVDVLLAAWQNLDPDESWKLLIAGPPLEQDLLENLPHGVEVLGALPHDDLMQLLDRSKVAVLPSRDEAMPMFVLEALARRNAVISSTVGGIPAVLGDGAGALVAPGSVEELESSLSSLMSNDELCERVARAGFDRYRDSFSADAIYPAVEELWLSVL